MKPRLHEDFAFRFTVIVLAMVIIVASFYQWVANAPVSATSEWAGSR